MKKYLLPLLLLLLSVQLHASLRQTQYRWRNDDGNETSATWRAAVNTPISVNDTTTVLRLRMELDNDNGNASSSSVNETLEYSSDGGSSWTPITGAPTDAFTYVTSTFVNNGDATTNQMGSGTFGTFVAGRIVTNPSATPMNLNDAERTEYEWVIRPTGHALPLATYTFQSSAQEDIPLNYPQINTGCIGVHILTTKDSSRCGPGVVQLKATSSTTTVKWYSAATGGSLLGTGTTFTTPVITASTTYYAAAAFGTTCESARTPVHAVINPVPVVQLGPDAAFCEGTSYTLNAGTFLAYAWDNGTISATRTVTAGGAYFVTVTGTGNCKGSDTINLQLKPMPVVNLGNDIFICPGETATLDAGNPGMQYQWDNNSTNQTRTVSTTGEYFVTVTNPVNSCINSDTVMLTVKDLPLGTLSAIYGDTATYTFKVLNPMFAVGYTWNYGDGSPEGTGIMTQHTYHNNGVYLVKLTLVGDCDSSVTKTRTIDIFDARGGGGTGIGNATLSKDFLLYPNPAKNILYIESKSGLRLNAITVSNVLGQKISTVQPGAVSRYALQTTSLAPGIYLLHIETDKGAVLRKFEITE